MIIKNLITITNIINFTLLLSFFFLINKFYTEIDVRKKFFLFLIIFLIFLFIGLYYNLDGIIMLFAVSELSVLLIFITMYSQIYSYSKKNKKMFSYLIFFCLIFVNIQYFEINLLNYKSFYSFYNINLNDFYYIYNFYFEKQILLTIIVLFIITLYSIFFILLYFNLKKKQNIEQSKISQINLLRKQNILHQSNFSVSIRNFQKK